MKREERRWRGRKGGGEGERWRGRKVEREGGGEGGREGSLLWPDNDFP